jgi:predicted lipoprotein with Yx(FWY)xxD motif
MVRTHVRRLLTMAAVGVAVLAVVAVVPSAEASTRPTTASVISSVRNAKLGPILAAGTTVYTLKASKTGCNAACAKEWPPVVLPHGAKRATAGSNVDDSMLGTAKLAKRLQITYAGKRLYWSAKDTKAGQVHGNVSTKWGRWSTVTATAAAPDVPSTSVAPTTAAPTEAPTQPPATAAPETSPPETSPPETAPPETRPTTPPPTQPPATTSPGNGGIGF